MRTRSQRVVHPEQWTQVPVLIKIFKLLINELANAIDSNMAKDDEEVRVVVMVMVLCGVVVVVVVWYSVVCIFQAYKSEKELITFLKHIRVKGSHYISL